MTIFDATVLGVLQGITEFVPVSSSGHLILTRSVIGADFARGLAVDAVLQLATAISILVYFWDDLLAVSNRLIFQSKSDDEGGLLWALILGTVPAVVLGLLLEEYMATVFRTPVVVVGALVAGSVLMAGGEWLSKNTGELSPSKGLMVGCYQVLALVPGFSRSGATIAGGLYSGLDRSAATRFAFLLGFPVLFGSGGKKLWELIQSGALSEIGVPLVFGAVASFAVGLAVIHLLLQFLKDNSLYVFVWYRLGLAAVVVLFLI